MNIDDIPCVPTAMEECWARRLRCIRHRASFVTDPGDVDHSKLCFLAKPGLKSLLQSPAAALIWWKYFFLPFKKTNSVSECIGLIENPHLQVIEDTAWLQRRMCKKEKDIQGTTAEHKTEVKLEPAELQLRKRIVVDFHKELLKKGRQHFYTEIDIVRVKVLSADKESSGLAAIKASRSRRVNFSKVRFYSAKSVVCLRGCIPISIAAGVWYDAPRQTDL